MKGLPTTTTPSIRAAAYIREFHAIERVACPTLSPRSHST